MQMNKEVAALKIDFKIDEQGILRIIDVGDGIAAAISGFEDMPVSSRTLKYMHEMSGAAVATLYGELPYTALEDESLHVPLVLRPDSAKGNFHSVEDFSDAERILGYSQYPRLSSFVSCDWAHQKDNFLTMPVALTAMEMHKVLWYFLLEKHLPLAQKKAVAYWCNESAPSTVDFSQIDMTAGVFVKIADRSQGGANNVYYAKDQAQALAIMQNLHQAYPGTNENYEKHLYVIEPAYITIKRYKGKDYNVTGRAFLVLSHNSLTDELEVKITAAKWMFPVAAMSGKLSTEQMLSNIKNSIDMLTLTEAEEHQLAFDLLNTYGDVIKSAFKHEDLMAYCNEHPMMQCFISCMRPNASYLMILKSYYNEEKMACFEGMSFLNIQVNSLIARDVIKTFSQFLTSYTNPSLFFAKLTLTQEQTLEFICKCSFFENYILQIKNEDPAIHEYFSFIPFLIENEKFISATLDKLLNAYIRNKDPHYDLSDKNRALRQAANAGDVKVMKLLIYTRRANVNDLSPSHKTTKDYANDCKNEAIKPLMLQILNQVGAKAGHELLIENGVEDDVSMTQCHSLK